MEKKKMNYQNGKIYTIRSYQTDDVYYGSTTQPLSKRLSMHKRHYKLWQDNKKNYLTSFEIVKYNDCYIELVENYPCNSKAELEKFEGQCIRNNECINKNIPGRSKKQYREDNKDKMDIWYKQYREDNKEKISKQKKQYQEDNKEKIKQHKSQNHVCECGGKYTHCHKAIHMKSKKHITYIESTHMVDVIP